MKDMIILGIEKLMEIIKPLVDPIVNSGLPTVVGTMMIIVIIIGITIISNGLFDFIKESIRRAGARIIIKYNL